MSGEAKQVAKTKPKEERLQSTATQQPKLDGNAAFINSQRPRSSALVRNPFHTCWEWCSVA